MGPAGGHAGRAPMTTPTVPAGLRRGQLCAILGIAAAGLAVWTFPLVTGPISMALGALAWSRGERRARWIIPLAVVCMVAGLLFALIPENSQ